MKKNIFAGLGFIVLIILMIYLGIRLLSNKPRDDQNNPYEFNIDEFEQVDSTLIDYSEIRQINISAAKLKALTIDSQDQLYVAGDEKVLIYSETGKQTGEIQLNQSAQAVSVDETGQVYLAMLKYVQVYDNTGKKITDWPDLDGNAHFTSIAVSAKDVFVADAGNRLVWRFDKSGKLLNKIGEKDSTGNIPGFVIPSPYFDLQLGRDEFVWVVNPGLHLIQNYAAKGDLRTSWGKPAMTVDGFCGCCNPGYFAILNDGSFVTSEKGIVRVKVYDQQGEFKSYIAGKETFGKEATGLDLAVDSKNNIYVLDPKAQLVRVFSKSKKL